MTKLRMSSTTHTRDVKALLSLRDVGVTSKFSHFTSLGSGAWSKQWGGKSMCCSDGRAYGICVDWRAWRWEICIRGVQEAGFLIILKRSVGSCYSVKTQTRKGASSFEAGEQGARGRDLCGFGITTGIFRGSPPSSSLSRSPLTFPGKHRAKRAYSLTWKTLRRHRCTRGLFFLPRRLGDAWPFSSCCSSAGMRQNWSLAG